MGGGYTLSTAKLYGDQLAGAVIVDNAIHPPGMMFGGARAPPPAKKTLGGDDSEEEKPPARIGPPTGGFGLRAYDDEATIRGRFRYLKLMNLTLKVMGIIL